MTRVSESLILELMQDARIMNRVDELRALVLDELDWLCGLPIEVCDHLGGLAGMVGSSLRDRCIRAGHVTFAFLQLRIFDRAREHPFFVLLQVVLLTGLRH